MTLLEDSEGNKKSAAKVVKSSSSESHKKEIKTNISKKESTEIKSTKTEIKIVNGGNSELDTDSAIYSEVDKSKKKAKQAEAKKDKEVNIKRERDPP